MYNLISSLTVHQLKPCLYLHINVELWVDRLSKKSIKILIHKPNCRVQHDTESRYCRVQHDTEPLLPCPTWYWVLNVHRDGTIDKYPPDRSNRSYPGCWSYSSLYRRDRSIARNHQPNVSLIGRTGHTPAAGHTPACTDVTGLDGSKPTYITNVI